jgi:hypothetical protein
MSLRGMDLFFKHLFSEQSRFVKMITAADDESTEEGVAAVTSKTTELNTVLERIERLFTEPKFWKFSRDNSLKTRGEFFKLLYSLIDHVLLNRSLVQLRTTASTTAAPLSSLSTRVINIRQQLKSKLVPLVFYAIDEDSTTCSFFVWNSVLKIIKNAAVLNAEEDNGGCFWSLMNVKKAFVPKLVALLRSHANGNANAQNIEVVYASLCPLVSCMSVVYEDSVEEKLALYKDIVGKLYDGVAKEVASGGRGQRFGFASNRAKMIGALFDTASFIFENLIKSESEESRGQLFEFFSANISANVKNLNYIYNMGLN